VIVDQKGAILPSHLPRGFGVADERQPQVGSAPALPIGGLNQEPGKSLGEIEKAHINLTLKSTDNIRKQAAGFWASVCARSITGWLPSPGRMRPLRARNGIGWRRRMRRLREFRLRLN
jgi:hypothetical protein